MAFSGEILRRKREALGFSLQDITDHLSIPADIIRAFEASDVAALPNQGIADGFLRSYCNFLGIEAETMIAEFRLATRSRKVKSSIERETVSFSIPRPRMPQFSIPVSGEVLAWISITALLLLGWFAYTTFIPASDAEPENKTEAAEIELRVPEVRRVR